MRFLFLSVWTDSQFVTDLFRKSLIKIMLDSGHCLIVKTPGLWPGVFLYLPLYKAFL